MPRQTVKSEESSVNSEDPMRELVALTERVELTGEEGSPTIVAGFRPDGRLSIYFGEDPYYQFDAEGRFRRAFVDGRLFRTQGASLAALTRSGGAVLVRHDLVVDELEAFLADMLKRLGCLREALRAGHLMVIRQVPAKAAVVPRLLEALDAILKRNGELAPAINRVR
jgi:hypothetical protein